MTGVDPPRRMLEIGHLALVKTRFPDETVYINTEFATLGAQTAGAKLRTAWSQFRRLVQATLQRPFDLVICRCFGRFIYRQDFSLPVNLLRYGMGWVIRGCVWVQVAKGARLAVVDLLDESTLAAADLFLLKRCERYFKRELPQNGWDTFLRVQPPHGEYYLLTKNPRFEVWLQRLLPISISVFPSRLQIIEQANRQPQPDDEKLYDIFYAGPLQHSTVRLRGYPQLEELRRRGWRVEISTGYTTFEEYLEKIRRSWLAWSPAGQGWDCYRHYEVCLAGAVPLINYPTIQRYQPLREEEHCFFYAIEGDELCQRAEAALADKARLRRIAAAARAHVLEFHTYSGLGRYIVDETLNPAGLGQAG